MKFKLKLVKQSRPKVDPGLWEQLDQDFKLISYDKGKFSLGEMKKVIGEMYTKKPTQRSVKITTNQAGYELFQKALENEFKKQKNDRKRLSIKSKVFK
jgi:hypothetical protein